MGKVSVLVGNSKVDALIVNSPQVRRLNSPTAFVELNPQKGSYFSLSHLIRLFSVFLVYFRSYQMLTVGWVLWHINPCGLFNAKLVDRFTYHNNSVSSAESDIHMCLAKEWTAINRLSIIWNSVRSDKLKWNFFQAAAVSVLLYGCTTWMLTKHMEKKLHCNYTRTLRAILNKSWKQHSTKHQLNGHLPLISKTI